jgi:hypothetical protein
MSANGAVVKSCPQHFVLLPLYHTGSRFSIGPKEKSPASGQPGSQALNSPSFAALFGCVGILPQEHQKCKLQFRSQKHLQPQFSTNKKERPQGLLFFRSL